MPFVSQAQRRFMYARHPHIAARWQKKTGKKKLPEKVDEGRQRTAAMLKRKKK